MLLLSGKCIHASGWCILTLKHYSRFYPHLQLCNLMPHKCVCLNLSEMRKSTLMISQRYLYFSQVFLLSLFLFQYFYRSVAWDGLHQHYHADISHVKDLAEQNGYEICTNCIIMFVFLCFFTSHLF